MKQHLTHIVLTAGLAALLGSVTLSAQDRTEIAEVPFAFHANNRTLPAGKYKVQEYREGLFIMYDKDAHSLFLPAPNVETREPSAPSLVFRCYGNERVLATIWLVDGSGYDLGKSSIEKNLNRKLQMATLLEVRLTER